MSKYEHIQKAAYDANMQLPKLGLVLFTFGNVSAADRKLGVFAIKPSGVPYEDLSPSKMVIVDFEGQTVKGKLRPRPIPAPMRYYTNIGSILAGSFIPIPPMLRPGRKASATYPFTALPMPIIPLPIFPAPRP